MEFNQNVFINCPYDEDYFPLLRPILFVTYYAGLTPRLALERMDSGEARINKIAELVRDSRYAIHDLSRLQAENAGDYFRLNMPFELGLDVGCRLFGGDQHGDKCCLILEAQPYGCQRALSDLSNSDIAAHHNDPMKGLVKVRHWLVTEVGVSLPGPSALMDIYSDFHVWMFRRLIANGFSEDDAKDVPIPELMGYMRRWVADKHLAAAST